MEPEMEIAVMPTELATAPKGALPKNLSDTVRDNWGWFLALGIVFVIGGLFAIALPLVSSLAVGVFLAVILAIAGVVQIVHAFRIKAWGGFLLELLLGIAVLLGGIAMYVLPVFAALAITIVVAASFLAKGVFQILLAFRLRPRDGWGWILAAGIVALVVGVAILAQYPFSGLWVPGVLAGVSLIFTGWSYVALGLGARQLG